MSRYLNRNQENGPVEVATRISHPRDPPGQRSIYIIPGRVWQNLKI